MTGLPPESEAEFRGWVLNLAALEQWTVFYQPDSRMTQAGLPDLLLIRAPELLWAELKKQTGRVSKVQALTMEKLQLCGQRVYVWRPSDRPEIRRTLARRFTR